MARRLPVEGEGDEGERRDDGEEEDRGRPAGHAVDDERDAAAEEVAEVTAHDLDAVDDAAGLPVHGADREGVAGSVLGRREAGEEDREHHDRPEVGEVAEGEHREDRQHHEGLQHEDPAAVVAEACGTPAVEDRCPQELDGPDDADKRDEAKLVERGAGAAQDHDEGAREESDTHVLGDVEARDERVAAAWGRPGYCGLGRQRLARAGAWNLDRRLRLSDQSCAPVVPPRRA